MAWPCIGEQVMELFRAVASEERDAAWQGIPSSLAGKPHVALGATPSVHAVGIALVGNLDR